MVALTTQSNIPMSNAGFIGRAASGKGRSKLLTSSEVRGLLGTGSGGLGTKYLADDSTWKSIDLSIYLTTTAAASTYLTITTAASTYLTQSSATTLLASKADLVGGVVPSSQIPAIAITEYLGSVASQVAMLALVGDRGDWCIRTDLGTTWVLTSDDSSVLASWTELSYPTAPVTSVNGQTGSVTLAYGDVGAAAASHSHSANDITSGTISVNRLGSGSAGAGAKYLADDSTWKTIDLSPYLTTSTAASTYLPLAGGTLTGDLKFTDATYDIGKSGATRPRDGFFSRTITVGTSLVVSGYGSGASPAIEIAGGTGFYYITAGIAFKAYGDTNAAGILNSGFHLASNKQLSWASSTSLDYSAIDLILARDAAGILAQRNGTNAQTFRVYNNYTSSTAYEAAVIDWQTTSNVLRFGSNKGSAGGFARNIAIVHGGTVVANFLADRFYFGPIADSTATGGNARGENSVDLIILRTAANQVVSGARSFGAGARCQVSGNDAYVIGNDSWGTSQYSMSFGTFCGSSNYAAVVIGINGVASGNQSLSLSMGNGGTASALKSFICGEGVSSATNSWATGFAVSANRQGMAAYAQGAFAANGDAQKVWWVLRRKTTDATPTTLMVDGSSAMLLVTSGKILVVDILISGIKSDGTAAATYKRKVAIKNVGGTTSLVGSPETIGTDYEDNYLTDVAITADDTNDALQINVTGITGETWRWVAVVEGLEIAYGT